MDPSIIQGLDSEIERKKSQLEQLNHELATLLEARRILFESVNVTTNHHAAVRRPHNAERPKPTPSSRHRTNVDDILEILNLTDRAMSPVEVRHELAKMGREVPQPVVTSTLIRIYKENRIWKVGKAQYAAKRDGDALLDTNSTVQEYTLPLSEALATEVISDDSHGEEDQ